MYKYNLNAIIIEANGRGYSNMWTKYIQVWYYMIKDCTAVGEVTLKNFPTGSILADHFT